MPNLELLYSYVPDVAHRIPDHPDRKLCGGAGRLVFGGGDLGEQVGRGGASPSRFGQEIRKTIG